MDEPKVLQLNQDKTEVIVFGNKEKRIAVSNTRVTLSKNWGPSQKPWCADRLRFDLSSHIKSITKTAFYQLKNISRVKGFMSQQTRRS